MWTNLATETQPSINSFTTRELTNQAVISLHRVPLTVPRTYGWDPLKVYTQVALLLERVSESPGNSCCWLHDHDLKTTA